VKEATHEAHCLTVFKNEKQFELALTSFDSNHAQAQASDICRALEADSFSLSYKQIKEDCMARLFKKLAFNDFESKVCSGWDGKYTNGVPCVYIFGKRIYVKNLILRYLDIPKDETVTKSTCRCKTCINPYHFMYLDGRNSKLSCGDLKLLLAYRGQGTSIEKVAQAFNVHRSTLYRRLKNERLSTGTSGHK